MVDQYGIRDLQVEVQWRWKLGRWDICGKQCLVNTLSVQHGIINWKTVISGTSASLGILTGLWTGDLVPVLQQLFLEADNRCEHGFVLDFGGWDDNAAVHEVCHSVCELTGGLCLKGGLIENLEPVWTQFKALKQSSDTAELFILTRECQVSLMYLSCLVNKHMLDTAVWWCWHSLYQPTVLPWLGQSHDSPHLHCWDPPGQRGSGQAWGPPRQSRVLQVPSDAQTRPWAFPGSLKLLIQREKCWNEKTHMRNTQKRHKNTLCLPTNTMEASTRSHSSLYNRTEPKQVIKHQLKK